MGVPAANLEKTVAQYNKLAEDGRDTFLGKSHQYLRPISGTTYYAIKLFPFSYTSLAASKSTKVSVFSIKTIIRSMVYTLPALMQEASTVTLTLSGLQAMLSGGPPTPEDMLRSKLYRIKN